MPRLAVGLILAIAFIMLGIASEVCAAGTRPAPGGVSARVCRWHGGKKAALSLRFDDSDPTQADVALPMLNEFGFIGTFLVNPGTKEYKNRQAVWEGAALAAGHELGDHTLNHRGAKSDTEADRQIGELAELLHQLQPGRGLIAFEPGGATLWLQRKPFSFFDAKYHLYDINAAAGRNEMSCTEVYDWFSVAAFRDRLEKTIAEGGWFQPYFHEIDTASHLRISPATFRQVLETCRTHQADLWQAGMAATYEYRQERDNAAVWVQPEGDDALAVYLTCATDPKIYREPLTLEVDLPGPVSVTAMDSAGNVVPARIEQAGDHRVLRFEVAPTDARFTVRAAGLGAAFRLSVVEMRAPGPHPYVLFAADDVAEIMDKTKDPLGQSMWEKITKDADAMTHPQSEPQQGARPRRNRSGDLRVVAFAYAMTHRPVYARAAIASLEQLAASTSWHPENIEMLRTAGAICTMGLAYDWLYDEMTEPQRAQVRTAIIEHGIKPILATTEKTEFWTDWPRSNWGAAIYGQAGVAALALLPEVPEAADWVRLSQRKIWHYTHSLGEDGSWGESGTYAAYAWSNAILFMDALRHVTGYDFFTSPRLPNLPHWFITLLEPDGRDFVPFADCDLGNSDTAEVLFRLAREYRDGRAQFVGRQMTERRSWYEIFAFLWYDPSLAPRPLSDQPLDDVFPGVDWAFLRSGWENPNATLFGLKGGQQDWDHQHHDFNSFALYAHGRPLVIDLFYPHKIWGCLTEAHNAVMVNGKDQRGEVKVAGNGGDPEHHGLVLDLVDTPWYARVVGDASLGYDPTNLSSFVREVMYLRNAGTDMPPDYFVMFDDIRTPTPSSIDWLLHTYGDVRTGGSGLTITQDDAAVDITLIGSQPLRSEVQEKSFEEAGSPKPFETAKSVKTITVRPAGRADRAFFVSVLAPRDAAAPAQFAVEAVQQPGVLGAEIASGETRDLALFALDAPAMSAKGVEAVGRSCFLRTAGGRVRAAVLHNGERLSAGGVLLFDTNTTGHAVLNFREDMVEAELALYDPQWAEIHVARRPAQVLVNGKERAFEYVDADQCVKISGVQRGAVRILY